MRHTTNSGGGNAALRLNLETDPYAHIERGARYREAAMQQGADNRLASLPAWHPERAEERQRRLVTLEARAHECHAATCTAAAITLLLCEPAPPDYSAPQMREVITDTRINGQWHR